MRLRSAWRTSRPVKVSGPGMAHIADGLLGFGELSAYARLTPIRQHEDCRLLGRRDRAGIMEEFFLYLIWVIIYQFEGSGILIAGHHGAVMLTDEILNAGG